jgi:predicted transcriptional regulator YdeE
MDMTVAGPIEVLGYSVRTKNADEGDPRTGKIGPLWGRIFKERILERVPGATGARIYAVYGDYESDENGHYTLVVGRESRHGGPVPQGMTRVSIPRASYTVFEARGEMPRALIETWGRVWKAQLRRAFTTDFELHDPADPARVAIHIATK